MCKNKLDNYTISFHSSKTKVKLDIFTNISIFGLDIESALDCWLARTKEFTEKSFCEYICSKDINIICLSREQYLKSITNGK